MILVSFTILAAFPKPEPDTPDGWKILCTGFSSISAFGTRKSLEDRKF